MEIADLIKQDNSKISFNIRLEREEWESFISAASKELQKEKPIPGFRTGTAPLTAAENIFGSMLYRAAADRAVPEVSARACHENGFEPVSDPDINVITADQNGFECAVSFFNYPEITDFNYRGLEAERPFRVVTDDDIDREAKHFMQNHLNVHEVDREARMGDIAEVSFSGTTDGHPFPFDHSSKSRFILGSGKLFAGLDEVLEGHRGGDEMDISLTMPKDFHRERIAGMTVDLHVDLKGVWARDLCELNDEFVRERVRGCDTVEEFRDYLRSELERRYEGDCETIFEENLQRAMAGAVAGSIPYPMILTVSDRVFAGLERRAVAEGKTLEDLLAAEGRTVESFRDEILPTAGFQAAYSVAVDYVIRNEHIAVTGEEMDAFCRFYAEQTDSTAEDVIRSFGGTENLREEMLSRKALQIVKKSARPVRREVNFLPGEDTTKPRLFGM